MGAIAPAETKPSTYGYTFVEKLKKFDQEDIGWLALNIYFEARSESLHGKMVVAFVTINRALHRPWPDNITDVVTQPYQFSWYNDKRIPVIKEDKAWEEAKDLAKLCVTLYNDMAESDDFLVDGITKGATHYFADYIAPPRWASKLNYIGKVGKHLLYK